MRREIDSLEYATAFSGGTPAQAGGEWKFKLTFSTGPGVITGLEDVEFTLRPVANAQAVELDREDSGTVYVLSQFPPRIHILDTVTGAVERHGLHVDGAQPDLLNRLSEIRSASTGRLYVARHDEFQVLWVDPTSGAVTPWISERPAPLDNPIYGRNDTSYLQLAVGPDAGVSIPGWAFFGF
jgi:hypothetical protein